jgi:hypothetical protein
MPICVVTSSDSRRCREKSASRWLHGCGGVGGRERRLDTLGEQLLCLLPSPQCLCVPGCHARPPRTAARGVGAAGAEASDGPRGEPLRMLTVGYMRDARQDESAPESTMQPAGPACSRFATWSVPASGRGVRSGAFAYRAVAPLLVSGCLQREELCVVACGGKQFTGSAGLDDAALVQHKPPGGRLGEGRPLSSASSVPTPLGRYLILYAAVGSARDNGWIDH